MVAKQAQKLVVAMDLQLDVEIVVQKVVLMAHWTAGKWDEHMAVMRELRMVDHLVEQMDKTMVVLMGNMWVQVLVELMAMKLAVQTVYYQVDLKAVWKEYYWVVEKGKQLDYSKAVQQVLSMAEQKAFEKDLKQVGRQDNHLVVWKVILMDNLQAVKSVDLQDLQISVNSNHQIR